MLIGEVGALVDPSDCLRGLAKRAHGFEVLARAFHHQPATKPPVRALNAPLVDGLAAAFASLVVRVEAVGWVVRAEPDRIGLHSMSKRGRPLKHPTIALDVADTSIRPFYVVAPEGASWNFGSAERARAHLADVIERFTPSCASPPRRRRGVRPRAGSTRSTA